MFFEFAIANARANTHFAFEKKFVSGAYVMRVHALHHLHRYGSRESPRALNATHDHFAKSYELTPARRSVNAVAATTSDAMNWPVKKRSLEGELTGLNRLFSPRNLAVRKCHNVQAFFLGDVSLSQLRAPAIPTFVGPGP